MAWVDLLPQFPHLQIHSIQQEGQHVVINLVSTRDSKRCSLCQTQTQKGHGWFTRRIHSLPCSGMAVVFLIQAWCFHGLTPLALARCFEKISPSLLLEILAGPKRRYVCCPA